MEYVEFARKVAAGLRGVNQKLEDQFDEAAHAAERSFQPAIEQGQSGSKNGRARRGRSTARRTARADSEKPAGAFSVLA